MRRKVIVWCLLCCLILNSCEMTEKNKKNMWWYERCVGIEQDIPEVQKNTDVIVGIIDSGIKIDLEDISDSVYINQQEIENNGIDDDMNGYVDDVNGWNFYDNSNEIFTTYSSDYHGTMLAGIISGKKYGVSSRVKYLPLKCFRGTEGGVDDIIRAIEYGYDLGVRIFNCSWDMEIYNKELEECIRKYSDAIFVCASGKKGENLDQESIYPACFEADNIICVGALDSSNEIQEFSGYGSKVDIYAPGEEIYCLMPDDTYVYSEGSSLATALVTATIAYDWSVNGEKTCSDVKKELKKYSVENENILILDAKKYILKIEED